MNSDLLTIMPKSVTYANAPEESWLSSARSDTQLRTVLNIMPIGAGWLDQEGRCAFVNSSFVILFGYTVDEITDAEQWLLTVCPDSAPREAIAAWCAGQGTAVQCDIDSSPVPLDITCKDGTVKQIFFMARPALHRLILTFRERCDLSDTLKTRIAQAVEELHQKDDILASQNRLLVDLAPEAIIVFDTQLGRITDANVKAEELFGCSRDILLTSSPLQFYMQKQPDGLPVVPRFYENCERIIAGEVLVIERAIRGASGNEVVCEVRLVRLPSPHNLLIRASFFDITERLQIQNELTNALAYEHRLNEEQRQFMGLVSHELRTPLSIIDGTAQLMAMTACKDKECLIHAERILSSTKRLSSLIDTCLTEERLCTSGWTPVMVSEDIRNLALNVIIHAQTGTDQHLILSDLDGFPDLYDCDPMLIKVMLNNLLDNA
ncbi:MAG: PAS domain S-box protein, partial [Desulfuromonadaceae bacterium]|nr:PAS domain S-box protein [Desulfuromonadaceae bacterium]